MIVTFIGHGETNITGELSIKLTETIETCIKDGADTFYCGGYGNFDNVCAAAVRELKEKYPTIKSFFVTPYITEGYQERLKWITDMKLYDEIVYPELENVPLKFAISKRNEWMIDCADMVVSFVYHTWGGAATTLRYAKRKKKTIINLAD